MTEEQRRALLTQMLWAKWPHGCALSVAENGYLIVAPTHLNWAIWAVRGMVDSVALYQGSGLAAPLA